MKPGIVALVVLFALALAFSLASAKAVYGDYRCAVAQCRIVK